MKDSIFKNRDELRANLEIELGMLRSMLSRFKNSAAEIMVTFSSEGSIDVEVTSKFAMEGIGEEDCSPSMIGDVLMKYYGK